MLIELIGLGSILKIALVTIPIERFLPSLHWVATSSITQIVVEDETQICQGEVILDADQPCPGDGWEPEEEELYQLINEYRVQYGLPVVPRSSRLTLVANRHVRDMVENIGYLTHSWSDCNYDANNPDTYSCSSRAPRRLGTGFRGKSYENAHFNPGGATAESAFAGWSRSRDHNALILNQSNWYDNEWDAMGIGIYRQYAVLWVSERRDRVRELTSFRETEYLRGQVLQLISLQKH